MPTFTLGDCSVDLAIVPLAGPLAPADRQCAWRLVLELLTRPRLRGEAADLAELFELVTVLRRLLAEWPAAQVERPDPGHLGRVALSVIDCVLMPCLLAGSLPAPTWQAVRTFLQTWALELVHTYGFGDIGADLPSDLRAAWQAAA